MFSLIYVWIKGWVNNREAGDLKRHHPHYDNTVMKNGSCIINHSRNYESNETPMNSAVDAPEGSNCRTEIILFEEALLPTKWIASTIVILNIFKGK